MSRKLTTEEFKEKYRAKYGDLYNLDKVEYKGNKVDVIVTCPIHGDFLKTPGNLMDGAKCPQCSKTNKTTEEEFIRKAKYVHNNFFTYENCDFKGVMYPVNVTCPIHGVWRPKASNHLNGANCPQCSKEGITHIVTKLAKVNKSTKTYDNDTFIGKCKEVWGDTYILDSIKYVNHREKITPTCREHGEFSVSPVHFLHGRGCPKCGKNYRYTTDEVVEKFKEVHGDRYLYDKVDYKATHEKVLIGCKEHGYFEMSPASHLRGQGCPRCNHSILEESLCLFLTNNNIEFETNKRNIHWLNGLELDIYIPKYNVAIECQGFQHFEPFEYFGGEEKFKQQVERDKLKKQLCDEHGIKLLYYSNLGIDYPYEVFEDKEKLLEEIKKNENKKLITELENKN